jgi:hypothetical protein
VTAERFQAIKAALQSECDAEMDVKNADYAAPEDGDFLKNFHETAKRTGMSPYQAWLVHFEKHVMAIEKFCKTGGLASEPIRGRMKDGINYLHLLAGLIEECETSTSEPPDAHSSSHCVACQAERNRETISLPRY